MINLKREILESNLVDRTCSYFRRWFYYEKEVWSDCHTRRIDIVLKDKNTGSKLGIEAKSMKSKKGDEIGKHIFQSMRYSLLDFGGQRIPIFLAPPLSIDLLVCNEGYIEIPGDVFEQLISEYGINQFKNYLKNDNSTKIIYVDRHHPDHDHHTINGILGAFNVGEIRTYDIHERIKFIFSNQIIWDNKHGLRESNYQKLIKKINEFSI